jgi:LmbE family N-acetylglucosaminyl deacetylase
MQQIKNLVVSARRFILRVYARLTSISFSEAGSIMIIAPHPDDEVFGCGGMLAGRAANGKATDIVFLTGGEASHKGCCTVQPSQVGAQRRCLAGAANEILGIPQKRLQFLGGNDGKLPHKGQDGFIDLAEKIAACLEKSAPEAVFCPHPFEGWSDHIAAEELTRAALKMLAPGPMPRLYHYCVWFWYSMPLKRACRIDWRRARLLDISEQLPLKQKAMRTYLDALAPCGHPWVGKLPPQFLRAFDWDKELFFEADISNLKESS